MTDDSFKDGINELMQNMIGSNKLSTAYALISSMLYVAKPCEIKVLWQSSQPSQQSFGFPKNSPLLPFFKYAYKKLRQTGTLKRISEKWRDKTKSSKCGKNNMTPLTFKKLAALYVLLLIGTFLAAITLVAENIAAKTIKKQ